MSERDLARSIGAASYHAARETRAIRRGVVDSIRDDGRAVVTLPNGAKVIRGLPGFIPERWRVNRDDPERAS